MKTVLVVLALLLATNANAEENDAEEEKADQAIRDDRKAMGAVFGAEQCLLSAYRNGVMERLKKEKKYNAISGVENRAVLYKLQQQLMHADDSIAKSKRELRGFKGVVALPCNHIEVKRVIFCFGNEGKCEDANARKYARMASMLESMDADDE